MESIAKSDEHPYYNAVLGAARARWTLVRFDARGCGLSQGDVGIDFSMAIDKTDAIPRWFCTCWRPHLLLFYSAVMGNTQEYRLYGVSFVRQASELLKLWNGNLNACIRADLAGTF